MKHFQAEHLCLNMGTAMHLVYKKSPPKAEEKVQINIPGEKTFFYFSQRVSYQGGEKKRMHFHILLDSSDLSRLWHKEISKKDANGYLKWKRNIFLAV